MKGENKFIKVRIIQKLRFILKKILALEVEPLLTAVLLFFVFNRSIFESFLISYSVFLIFNYIIKRLRGIRRA